MPAPRRLPDGRPLSSDTVRAQEGPLSYSRSAVGCSAPLRAPTPHRQWTEQLQAPGLTRAGGPSRSGRCPLLRSSLSPGRAQAPEEGPASPPAASESSSARVRRREAVALWARSSRTGSAVSSRDLLIVTAGTGALLAARVDARDGRKRSAAHRTAPWPIVRARQHWGRGPEAPTRDLPCRAHGAGLPAGRGADKCPSCRWAGGGRASLPGGSQSPPATPDFPKQAWSLRPRQPKR